MRSFFATFIDIWRLFTGHDGANSYRWNPVRKFKGMLNMAKNLTVGTGTRINKLEGSKQALVHKRDKKTERNREKV